ncbi:MAG: hypothetical protein RLY43_983 [Bacteroidota bacterium]|jgi:hypothetical protein
MSTSTYQNKPLYELLFKVNSLSAKLLRDKVLTKDEAETLRVICHIIYIRPIPIKL